MLQSGQNASWSAGRSVTIRDHGLGGEDADHPYVEHAGGGQGIKDLMWLYPNEGIGIILMGNAAGYDDAAAVDATANVVFSIME